MPPASRLAAILLAAVLLAACDSQRSAEDPPEGAEPHPLVGAWTVDSSGTAETLVPTFSGPGVNFAAHPTGGQAVVSGEISATLRYAFVSYADPQGHREAVFASYDLSGDGPATYPAYHLDVRGGAGGASWVGLYVQRIDGSSTYQAYHDGPAFVIEGDRITLPSVDLYELGAGRPPVRLEGGSFTFPTVEFVAGQPFLLRRHLQNVNNSPVDIRYVLEADGSYQIQRYDPPTILSVSSEGRWEAGDTELILRLGQDPDGSETRFAYDLAGNRLVLTEAERGCQANPACLDAVATQLGLPPGAIASYARDAVTTLYR